MVASRAFLSNPHGDHAVGQLSPARWTASMLPAEVCIAESALHSRMLVEVFARVLGLVRRCAICPSAVRGLPPKSGAPPKCTVV